MIEMVRRGKTADSWRAFPLVRKRPLTFPEPRSEDREVGYYAVVIGRKAREQAVGYRL